MKTKSTISLLCTFAFVVCILSTPAYAAPYQTAAQENLMQYGNVYIPSNTNYFIQNGETIYTNFYDSVNHFTYSYYNITTHDHFAISDPIELPISAISNPPEPKIHKVIAHEYSFAGTGIVNGKTNGITFNIDLSSSSNVYIEGDAEMYSMATGEITSNNYPNGYKYTVALARDVPFGYEKNIIGYAGSSISGTYSNCKSGTHYLIMTPNDRINGADRLRGSGLIYYYA